MRTRRSALLFLAFAMMGQATWARNKTSPHPVMVTGSATLVSQYRFRGISLSDEKTAVQGTINLNHESGGYFGIWGSLLDGFGELGGSNLELDIYAGYRHKFSDATTTEIGLLYYAYPGSAGGDYEFFEPYANVIQTIGPATAKVGVSFAPSQSALNDHSNIYVFGELSTTIPNTPVMLTSHVGWSKGNTPLSLGDKYMDWSLGAFATWRAFTIGVTYVDTDIGEAQAIPFGATKGVVDAALIISLSAAL